MTDVSVVDTGAQRVSRRSVIDASPAELFDLVADPRRHGELDGSGTVHGIVSGPNRLTDGATFSVRMTKFGLPYRITSTVTGFEPDRLIEWRHPLGHRWRWQFVQSAPGRTEVTETFDYSGLGMRGRALEVGGFPRRNGAGITATLNALHARFRD